MYIVYIEMVTDLVKKGNILKKSLGQTVEFIGWSHTSSIVCGIHQRLGGGGGRNVMRYDVASWRRNVVGSRDVTGVMATVA